MDASFKLMGNQMPACVVFVLLLYITQASCLSFGRSYVEIMTSEQLKNRQQHQLHWRTPQMTTIQESPTSLEQEHLSREPEVALRRNRVSDIFVESSPTINNSDQNLNQVGGGNIDQQQQQQLYNSINLDSSLEFKPEIVTSNHQSYDMPVASSGAINQNSRHYNQYHKLHNSNYLYNNHQKPSHHGKHNQKQNYIKYSPNIFANNYNLNYIHSFLTNKPPPSIASSTPSSGIAPNLPPLNPLPGSSYGLINSNSPQATPQQHHYISASSAFSAALTSTHQTTAHQQLVSINNQLQSLDFESAPPTVTSSAFDEIASNATGTGDSLRPGPSWPNCGRQQVAYREPRIVGGNSTYEGEFPWAVSIQRHGNHHCGGVIVSRRWILTAAHCVRSQLVANLAVRTGGHTLSKSANSLSDHLDKDYQIEQIVMHDDFSRYDNLTASQMKSSANTNNADIALLKLRHEIHLNDLAWPVCFPPLDAGNFSGRDATVIGWGKLSEKSEEFSNELQKVKLTIIDNKVCQNWFRQAGREMPIDDRIICAGFKHGGKDACHGDSGGPLLSRINGQYSVVGVVSTGIGCARPLLPGLYSRVSSYLSWIEHHISI